MATAEVPEAPPAPPPMDKTTALAAGQSDGDGSTDGRPDAAAKAKADAAKKVFVHAQARFELGKKMILLGGATFVIAAGAALLVAWKVPSSAIAVELVMLSAAIFAGACFALAGRLTTSETALIQMKSGSPNAAAEAVASVAKALQK